MRPLIAGNWKMNGLAALAGRDRGGGAHVAAAPPACRHSHMPARHADRARGRGRGRAHRHRRAGLPCGRIRRVHRRHQCGDAQGCGRVRRDRRPFRAASISRRNRCGSSPPRRARHGVRGFMAIVCVGETEAQRDEGEALNIVTAQIAASVPAGATPANTAIAYEPVWAIGTGRTPTMAEIAQMHAHIRRCLGGGGVRILYGGSVKPANARGNSGPGRGWRGAGGRGQPQGSGFPRNIFSRPPKA